MRDYYFARYSVDRSLMFIPVNRTSGFYMFQLDNYYYPKEIYKVKCLLDPYIVSLDPQDIPDPWDFSF